MNRVQSGADANVMVITFYASVAAGAVGGVGAGFSAARQAAIAIANKGASEGTSLLLRSDKENITPKEVSKAVFNVALAGATTVGTQKLAETLKAISPVIGQRIAAKAVDRYCRSLEQVNPQLKAELLKKVSEVVRGRMLAIGMAVFTKALNQVQNFPNEPTFNFWENIFAPIVGNGLGEYIRVYVSNSPKYKQTLPNK